MYKLNGKKVALDQLETELRANGFELRGLGKFGDWIFTYSETGEPAELPSGIDDTVSAHVPTRYLTDEELNIAFADALAAEDQARVNDILAQAHGLKPRARIPI